MLTTHIVDSSYRNIQRSVYIRTHRVYRPVDLLKDEVCHIRTRICRMSTVVLASVVPTLLFQTFNEAMPLLLQKALHSLKSFDTQYAGL
jgi:hypothetical protein